MSTAPPMAEYKRKGNTKMTKIDGPFEVETLHGVVVCADGYLAVDSGGWPYPIAAAEFERIYQAV